MHTSWNHVHLPPIATQKCSWLLCLVATKVFAPARTALDLACFGSVSDFAWRKSIAGAASRFLRHQWSALPTRLQYRSSHFRTLFLQNLAVRKSVERSLSIIAYDVKVAESDMFDFGLCDFSFDSCVVGKRSIDTTFRQYIVGTSAHDADNDSNRSIQAGDVQLSPSLITKDAGGLEQCEGISNTIYEWFIEEGGYRH